MRESPAFFWRALSVPFCPVPTRSSARLAAISRGDGFWRSIPTRFANLTQCPPLTSAYPASRDAKAAVRFVRKHAAKYNVSPDHLISLGCSAGGWTSTTLAIAAESEWRDELSEVDPTLGSTNLGVSSKVQAAVVMSGGPQAYDLKAVALGAAYESPYDTTDAPMIMLHGADDFIVNVSTNVGKNRAGYAKTGVPFEAHVFANTSHCEKEVESEASVVKFSIPFVAKHTGLVLKD
jgi:dienelactone hydrolase|eukprot:SAG25_NODE_365_length_9126_cov_7.904952_4_plen_235_part_00